MAIVLRAKTAGFCMGVGLALRKLDQAIKEHKSRSSGRLVMLGPIIHNPQVMNTYMQQGVVLAHSLDAVQPGDTVIIRAHGIPREDEARLLDLGALVLDATCPKVKQAQLAIDEAHPAGDFPLPVRRGRTSGSAGARLLCQRPMPRVWELEGIERKTDVQRYPQCGAGGSNHAGSRGIRSHQKISRGRAFPIRA